MTNEKTFSVPLEAQGERLDRFLAQAGAMSLRTARRLVRRGAAMVDGSARTEGYKLRSGQIVAMAHGDPELLCAAPRLIRKSESFAAFFKPSGLHSVSVCGSFEPSLEGCLRDLMPGEQVTLVNRLDRDTSGIVLGALTPQAAENFRALENAGRVDKRYLALVHGALDAPLRLKWALDTADRARVKVLDADSQDSLRWTGIRPITAVGGLTLVEACIAKGARHQIRAHLARAGYAIAGDVLYDGPAAPGLRLHHWCVNFPGFSAQALPDWEEVKELIEIFSKENACGSP
jgi:23S rRNA pseudouridine1911/1915/1917 synthase